MTWATLSFENNTALAKRAFVQQNWSSSGLQSDVDPDAKGFWQPPAKQLNAGFIGFELSAGVVISVTV
jgi:hypothetical protein